MNETIQSATNDEDLLLTRLVIQKIVTPLVVLIGVIGNSLSIVVLTRKCMKSSTNSYLTALAMFDILYLVFSFSLSLSHYPDTMMTSLVYVHWFPFGRVLTDMSSNVSVTLTVTFTIERYIGVCHPMKGRTLCTPQRARMMTALVSFVAILCTVPEFWELEVTSDINDVTNITEYGFRYTSFSEEPAYGVGYYWFLVLMFTFLPLVLLCIFNGILILTLIRAAKLRKEMSQISPNKSTFPRNRFVVKGPPVKWIGYRYYKNSCGNGATTTTTTNVAPPAPTTVTNTFYNAQAASAHAGANSAHITHHNTNAAYSKKNRSSHAKEQQKITKMLITVVLVFIVCQLPGALLLSYQTYLSLRQVTLTRYWSNVKKMAANVTNILVSINASINFILYSAISLRFRRVFYRVFCVHSGVTCWRSGRAQLNSMVESRTDAIQMSSYCDGNKGKGHPYHRQGLVYKSRSRSRSPFSKESRHWPSDSPVTSSDNNVTCLQHGAPPAKGQDNESYQSFHKSERDACFYS